MTITRTFYDFWEVGKVDQKNKIRDSVNYNVDHRLIKDTKRDAWSELSFFTRD